MIGGAGGRAVALVVGSSPWWSVCGDLGDRGSCEGLIDGALVAGEGDTLVVTKLDRLARSLPDARTIAEDLRSGGSACRWEVRCTTRTTRTIRSVGCCSTFWPMVAEFESDLIRMRTCEGMKIAKAKGRLRGKQPKLKPRPEAHLVSLFEGGEYTTGELADLFGVGRSTLS